MSFHSHLDSDTVFPTKFCTWHDSCAVVACAKLCCDPIASIWITAIRSLHRIWIAGKKWLVPTWYILKHSSRTELPRDSTWKVPAFLFKLESARIKLQLLRAAQERSAIIVGFLLNETTYGVLGTVLERVVQLISFISDFSVFVNRDLEYH